jgi:plastocyanin
MDARAGGLLFVRIGPVSLLGMLTVLLAVGLLAACRDSEVLDYSDQIPDGASHIDQRSLQFRPNSITVTVGESVYFTNSEAAIHRIDVNGEDVTGNMGRGDVVVFTFDAPGEYELTCPYHPQMRATVTVVER